MVLRIAILPRGKINIVKIEWSECLFVFGHCMYILLMWKYPYCEILISAYKKHITQKYNGLCLMCLDDL